MSFIEGSDRGQISLLSSCIDDYVAPEALVGVVDAFLARLDLNDLGFQRTVAGLKNIAGAERLALGCHCEPAMARPCRMQ